MGMLFENLKGLFNHSRDKSRSAQLRDEFMTIVEGKGEIPNIGDKISQIRSIYEESLKLLEQEIADTGFGEPLLSLQRALYREIERVLSIVRYEGRHHFLITIPVADRPSMLRRCLDSIKEQCGLFEYGGISKSASGKPVFNKISVLIMDDSIEESHRREVKEISSELDSFGIATSYVGLDEQRQLLSRLPQGLRQKLAGLIGGRDDRLTAHKGASATRNIAYIYLHAILSSFDEKVLICFIDSDEEFLIKTQRGDCPADIPFINYFYWLDKIFESGEAEVLTGKVVGDPPVSPAVMINTFLDDLIAFFESAAGTDISDKCCYHETPVDGTFSAEYHDMAKLFGYKGLSVPKKYLCTVSGAHTVRDCIEDFASRITGFFYGFHPTRTQLYSYTGDFLKTEKARTVYTGNYVFNRNGLRHFIPFAELKLRMAGPVLGRILRARIGGKFVSANLPLLHKRTDPSNFKDSFRIGISSKKNFIDLSEEFLKQFWGDVMLFSVDSLAESEFPNQKFDMREIAKTVLEVQENLWHQYTEKQVQTSEKILKVRNYLSDKKYWWNSSADMTDAVSKFTFFCSMAERNFGMDSTSMRKLSGQLDDGSHTSMIANAIHSFHEDERAWSELLKSALTVLPGLN
jgi:hypothetical protein